MQLDPVRFQDTLSFFESLRLINAAEVAEVMAMFRPDFPFARAMSLADTYHLHVKVDDTATLPREAILARGGVIENEREGYIKFAFPGGVNTIFSSIDVAQDDLIGVQVPKPSLDHTGIDLRQETAEVREVFDAITRQAEALGWAHASQGGEGKGVFCCHVEVSEKRWVYPARHPTWTRAIELAYGPLKVHGGKMGCDLRPINPTDPRASQAAAAGCCGVEASGGASHGAAHGAAPTPRRQAPTLLPPRRLGPLR